MMVIVAAPPPTGVTANDPDVSVTEFEASRRRAAALEAAAATVATLGADVVAVYEPE